MRQFLGPVIRFVPNYSDLTSPLTDLTKKEAPDTVQWTEPCQQTLTQVKAALGGGPFLHSPDFTLPFLLQTDASDRGLGAVLSQEVEGAERPVLYISRKLSGRETMYSTIEKECLAIKWAVLSLRYYPLRQEFTLSSDHTPPMPLPHEGYQCADHPLVSSLLSPQERGEEAACRMGPRPESGEGGLWQGGHGSARSAPRGRGSRRMVCK